MIAEGGEAVSWWIQLAVNVPVAAAVIYTVRMFLEHMKGERSSRDKTTGKVLEVLDGQRDVMTELTVEVRQQSLLLRTFAVAAGVDLKQK